MSKLKGTSLAGGSVNYERVDNDFYATDPNSVYALFNNQSFIYRMESKFLEPCCGQGHISKVIQQVLPEAIIESTDLIDRGFGTGGVDFLTKDYGDTLYDYVITNPPYSLAQEFIEKSLQVTTRGVAMFLKIQFLEGIGRHDFFKNSPLKTVLVFSGRQDPWRDGAPLNPATGKKWGSTMCFAWFIWEHGYEGEPTIKWIHPDDCKFKGTKNTAIPFGESWTPKEFIYITGYEGEINENDEFWGNPSKHYKQLGKKKD